MKAILNLRKYMEEMAKAKQFIAYTTASIHASHADMDNSAITKEVAKQTRDAFAYIDKTQNLIFNKLQQAINKYKNSPNVDNLKILVAHLEALQVIRVESPIKLNIAKMNEYIHNTTVDMLKVTVQSLHNSVIEMLTLMDGSPFAFVESAKVNAPLFNTALDYLFNLGDANMLEAFLLHRDISLQRLETMEQLSKITQIMNEKLAAHLFVNAASLKHLVDPKTLQFSLLDNDVFRQYIFGLNPIALRDAFACTNWELADFEKRYFDKYHTLWMMFTQDKVVVQLTAQCKIEDLLTQLDSKQLNILFGRFPDKIMAVLNNEEISPAARQQLARRLLQLSKETLGSNAKAIVQMGIYHLDGTYDLKQDKDRIYNNQMIADEIVGNWTGNNPLSTYAINWNNNLAAVSSQAYEFILTNANILEHIKLKSQDIKLLIAKAGAYLPPSTFLECINILEKKNSGKMRQVLKFFPEYLKHCQKFSGLEAEAVKVLAEKYYATHPGVKGQLSDRVMHALSLNKDFNNKYTVMGAMIFAEGQTAHLEQFVKRAENYKVPGLLSDELINGFIVGAKMGILGLGLAVVIDKVTSIANIFNPISALSSSVIGNTFLTAAAGITSFLTGAGVGTTLAMIIAPLAMSIVVGGLIGAISNVGGNTVVKTLQKAGIWVSNQVFNNNDLDLENHKILINGLKSVDAQTLRKQLYADSNKELADNLAKMLLDQESKGFFMGSVPADIIAVIEPVKNNYYDTHKSILFKLPDYIFGNLLSATAFVLNVATFLVFDIYYPGPIANYFSYHSQKKLAAAMPDNSNATPASPIQSQAQTLRPFISTSPAPTEVKAEEVRIDIDITANEVKLQDTPPPYSPPRRSIA